MCLFILLRHLCVFFDGQDVFRIRSPFSVLSGPSSPSIAFVSAMAACATSCCSFACANNLALSPLRTLVSGNPLLLPNSMIIFPDRYSSHAGWSAMTSLLSSCVTSLLSENLGSELWVLRCFKDGAKPAPCHPFVLPQPLL
eukprot:TRINITY_DN7100_c0_g5_i1.p1 TRINITY_DN7100_c0_g5~~TRINITY_DN7100_c0_g5_i1.p1  ORF type:complete len:141 (+),score=11.87 TRINITY_DN7100_c0_g5_i1:1194-1616(+)